MIQGLVAAVTPLVLIVGGSNYKPIEPGHIEPTWLHGQFSDGNDVESVPYLAGAWPITGTYHLGPSVVDGVTNAMAMQNEAIAAGRPVIIMGASQGALIVDQIIANDLAAGVTKDQVSFVVIEDPIRGSGILTNFRGITVPLLDYKPIRIPDSPYDTTVVTMEYDGVADAPTNPLNLLADINAFLGQYQHQSSVFTDLSTVPAGYITTKTNSLGGVTTTYLVPNPDLPISWAMRQMGIPAPIVDFLNKVLRPIIDSAYAGRLEMKARIAHGANAAVATTSMIRPTRRAHDRPATVAPRTEKTRTTHAGITKPSAATRPGSSVHRDHRRSRVHRS